MDGNFRQPPVQKTIFKNEANHMSNKHPKCECAQKRYTYFRKRYRNQTLHLIRRCTSCGKPAQNPMRQDEYDRNWIDGLPVIGIPLPKPTVQSRAEQATAKLQNHIENREQTGHSKVSLEFRR